MSLLTERLPDSVTVSGVKVPIESGFRLMVELENLVMHAKEEDLAKPLYAILLRFYRGHIPENVDAAIEQMLYFFRCGQEEEKTEDKGHRKLKRAYDFDQDAEVIYTSFLQAYRVDLTTADVHWWQFRRLMFGLPSETPFGRRLYYRTADTKGMGKEERRRFIKFRNQFAVRETAARRETLAERNARMLAYVNRRFEEVANGKAAKS